MNKFMKDSLILQDNNYISAKRVQELFGYTSDYVGQLCRSGKIEAKMIIKESKDFFIISYNLWLVCLLKTFVE